MNKVQVLFFAIIFVIVIVCVELAAYVGVQFLKGKGVFYSQEASDSYDAYLEIRDELLGWPSPDLFGKSGSGYDATGSRNVPQFPDPESERNCISLYGDSFTWSAEVTDHYTWGNVLAKLVGCRVANFGVRGYGSDQAFLRYTTHTDDTSKVVFLNHLSENILRNVNQYRDFLYPGGGLGFKPRYVVTEHGSLQLIPLPVFSSEEYQAVVAQPSNYLEHEYFLPGGASGLSVNQFPYTLSVWRALNHFHIRANLRDEPWYLDFYAQNHVSGGLDVTTNILTSFNNLAKQRRQLPIVTIIPTGKDLLYYQENRVWPYQPLIDQLAQRSIPTLNFGGEIMDRIGDKDPCHLFDNCAQHFNELGYEMLARIAFDYLRSAQGVQDLCTTANQSLSQWCVAQE